MNSILHPFLFLFDPRLPIYFPINLLKWHEMSSQLDTISLPEKPGLNFYFTVDVEYDYGSGSSGRSKFVKPFLEKIRPLLSEYGINSTFFVQGNLVESHQEILRKLSMDHEIGLHGYAHEPWGSSWFVKYQVPSISERNNLLERSLLAFKRAGLSPPKSFRAPNMVLDEKSRSLLIKHNFQVDSSYPSYFGGNSILTKYDNLLEVPVSVDPKPFFSRFGIAHYNVFNTYNIATNRFIGGPVEAVKRLIRLQLFHKQKPSLVFLCHPWEFFDIEDQVDEKLFGYSSSKNFRVLETILTELKKTFKLTSISLSKLNSSD
ncbi:Polysaccharide deacetylase [Candidatus Bilamarchaeum dharawalense]|uniref:Polysaccharide deacetylase n=1 Tax=Candidatus Bilamarchaeum dharawalense TaxID=2885759 RepID=A0A5E4LQX0_9ARCH|nr:Polysaccharide deacetylase [Candidatus Bilamarchaeum dharawalense]